MPGGGRSKAVTVSVDIEEIGPAFCDRALGTINRRLELRGLLDAFSFHPEAHGDLGVVDIGTAEIAGHIATGLELAPAKMPDTIALVVVALVVEHNVHDRRLVARLRPERLRTAEQEAAVADDRDHRLIGTRKL